MGSPTDHTTHDAPGDPRSQFEDGLRAAIAEVFSATPWIAAVEIDQGALRFADSLRDAGASEILAVGARTGTGETKGNETPLISIGLPSAGSMVADIQSAQEVLTNPSAEVQKQIDEWDPDHRARVVGGLTMCAGPILGRPSFGLRPEAWVALEDKLAIEALWARAGIPVSPSAQVALADREDVFAEHARLSTELGTVWAGDNSGGWHGGGAGTHWVPDQDAAERLVDELPYEKVRIMPFVEGVPCSIHGMVLPMGSATEDNPEAIAVFRPCEMMFLRDEAEHRLIYGRAGSFWDPAPADRDVMRDVARRVGVELRRTLDFRGVFTVDGVMGADGFVPTEVNTRFGAALGSKIDTVAGDQLDLLFISFCLVEGLLDHLDLGPLEAWALDHLDANRRAFGFFGTNEAPETDRSGALVRMPGGSIVVQDDQPDQTSDKDNVVATVNWGQSASAGLLIFEFNADVVPTGPPTAPLLVDLVEAVDRAWNVDAIAISAARVVR